MNTNLSILFFGIFFALLYVIACNCNGVTIRPLIKYAVNITRVLMKYISYHGCDVKDQPKDISLQESY